MQKNYIDEEDVENQGGKILFRNLEGETMEDGKM